MSSSRDLVEGRDGEVEELNEGVSIEVESDSDGDDNDADGVIVSFNGKLIKNPSDIVHPDCPGITEKLRVELVVAELVFLEWITLLPPVIWFEGGKGGTDPILSWRSGFCSNLKNKAQKMKHFGFKKQSQFKRAYAVAGMSTILL